MTAYNPTPYETPVMIFSGVGLTGSATCAEGSNGKLLVVTGVDVVSSVDELDAQMAMKLLSSTASFFFKAVTSPLIEYASWRGALPIGPLDGLDYATSTDGFFDITVWGYQTALM